MAKGSSNNTARQKKYYRKLMKKKSKGKDITLLSGPRIRFSLLMLRTRKEDLNELMRSQTNKMEIILSLQRKNFYTRRNKIMKTDDLQGNVDRIIDNALDLYLEKQDLSDKSDLKYFINQHVTYQQVNVPDNLKTKKAIKDFLKELAYKILDEKKHVLINKKQANDFYQQVIISSMDGNWIDQVDRIEKIKVNAQQWGKSGRPQDLLHQEKAFEAYKDFLDKITLSAFDNLLLSKIFTNEKGQLVVVFN